MYYIEKFINHLKNGKKLASNSVEAYSSDIEDFNKFCREKGFDDLKDVGNAGVVAYLLDLKERGKSPSTVNRKLASLRAFYKFLIKEKVTDKNPTENIKTPKVTRKTLSYLTIEEVERLLAVPDESPKGIRDRAIMEILYATGIMVNELIGANIDDVNLRIGFFTCTGKNGKARIVPIGRPARKAVEKYIDVRDDILGDKAENALFLNFSKGRLTRQGLWKLFKYYGEKAGLDDKMINPHILRNSFGVHMVQNGADLKSLQELMGHEDLAATQIYLTVTKNRIKDVYDKTHPRA